MVIWTHQQRVCLFFKSSVAINLSGLFFKPAQQVETGQTIPSRHYQGDAQAEMYLSKNSGKIGEATIDNASFRSASAKVGASRMIQTSQGDKSCMPINYAAKVSEGALFDTVTQRKKAPKERDLGVTEWYCPSEGLTMLTEYRYKNKVYTMTLTHSK
ncbi:hypothetical protein V757_06395 [Pelistega indica]|uniref:Uncharacterized protein n=1 Tax=Pelistega indica TaxID=1414851 RepID=V8G5A6_9BURK|nr:hypothetical protein [Pelistega indica]ETD71719.1 hypothetical protein V757_06395 [Pelistega indica]